MEVAWKCTLHRLAQLPALGEGSLPASCALAGSPAHRTPTIGKMSERFTSMRLRWGGPCRPLLIVTAKCQRLMTESTVVVWSWHTCPCEPDSDGTTLTSRSITVQITTKGQVTIPQEIRNRLGLLHGNTPTGKCSPIG